MSNQSGSDNVKVVVRCRPFNQKELSNNEQQIVFVDKERGEVKLLKPDAKDMNGNVISQEIYQTFTYDGAYGPDSTQIEIFDETVRYMILQPLQGFNSTVFAYGQTSAGKTYTMMNSPSSGNPGMVPQAIQLIFDQISRASSNQAHLIRCSFYELYNEQIRDLLTNQINLPLKETKEKGVFIDGLSEHEVTREEELLQLLKKGNSYRSTASTNMNIVSSRSHCAFQIIIETATTVADGAVKPRICVGKLSLVDLAGSERVEKTGATGQRFKEGTRINLSLSNLCQVITKLVSGSDFIPYRQSKLTHILKDSLGGNSKTLMMVMVSPALNNYEETHSSLRYADQAKHIKNKARINEDPKDAQIREMQERIQVLEQQLRAYMQNGGAVLTTQQKQNLAGLQKQLNDLKVCRGRRNGNQNLRDPNSSPNGAALYEKMSENEQLEYQLQEKQRKGQKTREFVQEMEKRIEEQKCKIVEKEKLEVEAQELEREEREVRQQLADQRRQQMLLKRKLLAQEEEQLAGYQEIQSLQQQRETLTRKLAKYKELELVATNELNCLCSENAKDLQIRQNDLEDLQFMYKQKKALLGYFVPEEVFQFVQENTQFDEQNQCWVFKDPGILKCIGRTQKTH